jgi:hypothetical protein
MIYEQDRKILRDVQISRWEGGWMSNF